MSIRNLALSCLAAVSIELPANAYVFPRQDNPNLDVIYLADPFVDQVIKKELFENARVSIDVINFMHGSDTTGLTATRALRKAADRGVRVRYIYEFLGSLGKDPLINTADLLADLSLKLPAQVISARLFDKWKSFTYNDFIHEKVIIIDGGTSFEKVIIGGRGFTDFAITTYDSAFLLRPIDPKLPSITRDFVQHFSDVWDFFKTQYHVQNPRKIGPIERRALQKKTPPLITTDSQRRQLNAIRALIAKRPTSLDRLATNQFRPFSAQLIRNDFFKQLSEGRYGAGIDDRDSMVDDNVIVTSSIVAGAKKVTQATYAIAPPPKLEAAYFTALSKGADVRFYSNGLDAHKKLFPTGAPAYYTWDHVQEYVTAGIHARPAQLYLLNAERAKAAMDKGNLEAFAYLHRKLIVADDTVITGSDNFTYSSARKNSEIIVVMEDSRLASALLEQLESERAFYDQVRTHEELGGGVGSLWIYKLLKNQIRSNY